MTLTLWVVGWTTGVVFLLVVNWAAHQSRYVCDCDTCNDDEWVLADDGYPIPCPQCYCSELECRGELKSCPAELVREGERYRTARDKLVHDAATAVEMYGEDELERYAAEAARHLQDHPAGRHL